MSDKFVFSMLSDSICEKLSAQNITTPTAVQEKVIPLIMENKSVVFQSETGTGKTFAFLLPLIDRLEKDDDRDHVKIIIAAPTFELASQTNMAAKQVTQRKTALFIGGTPLKRQIESLKEKPQIVIGTPARLVELISLKKLKPSHVFAVVFDEADRLIKKELIDETKSLKSLLPADIQTIACSATITKQVKSFFENGNVKDAAKGTDSKSKTEEIIMPAENVLTKNISHWAIFAENREKIETLRKFITAENPGKLLIFTSRADQVENIYQKLRYKKIECFALHAKEDKQLRKAAIDKFRSGKCKILITSDLAARGLDIANITHVVQMDLPEDEDFFIHRCGRTARAGKTGINTVIGDEIEMRRYAQLEKKLGITVYPKEIYGGKVVTPDVNSPKKM